MYRSIEADVADLKTKIEAYHLRLLDFVNTTKEFKNDIAGLVAATNDPTTGLLSRFNCKFLGKSIDRVFDAMCVNYVTPLFKVLK